MNRPKSVSQYIAGAPVSIRPKLRDLRKLILDTVPQAQEKISYGMPYYGYHGRLAYFAYFKDHVSFFVMHGVLDEFPDIVRDLRTGKATLRLSLDNALPTRLLRMLVRRTAEKNISSKK